MGLINFDAENLHFRNPQNLKDMSLIDNKSVLNSGI